MADRSEFLDTRRRALEDEFFRKQDEALTKKYREMQTLQVTRDELGRISGIKNTAVLDKLVQLGVHAETLAALTIVPLMAVAWADGRLDDREKAAVLKGAAQSGIAPGATGYELLERWLAQPSDDELRTHLRGAWSQLVEGLVESMSPAEVSELRTSLLDRARAVAVASGGFLGLGSKVSAAEERVLQRLEAAFPPR
jgi:hypothetical protein